MYESSTVRSAGAQNPDMPGDVLQKLACDKEQTVRNWVCTNSNTPTHVLKQLASDGKSTVPESVAPVNHKLLNGSS